MLPANSAVRRLTIAFTLLIFGAAMSLAKTIPEPGKSLIQFASLLAFAVFLNIGAMSAARKHRVYYSRLHSEYADHAELRASGHMTDRTVGPVQRTFPCASQHG